MALSESRPYRNLFIFAVLLLLAKPGWSSVNIQNFNHSNSFGFESLNSLLVDDSDVHVVKSYSLNVAYSYNSKPLDMKNLANNVTVRTVIDEIQVLHLGGQYRFSDKVSLGVMSALVGVKPQNGSTSWKPQDTQVELNYTFYKGEDIAWGIIPFVTAPTGDRNNYLSDESVGYGALLMTQFRTGSWNFVAGLGYRFADGAVDAIDPLLNLRERLILELGLLKPLTARWDLLVEFKREHKLPLGRDLNPNELFLGGRYAAHRDLGVFAGLGSGDLTSTNTGDIRAHLGIKYAPQVKIVCRMVPENRDPFKIVLGFQHNADDSDTAELIQRLETYVAANRPNMNAVRVVGHTSAVGAHEYNDKLSLRRAKSVTSVLFKAGLPPELLRSEGRGERELLDKANNEKAHAVNRRVEVTAELKPRFFELCE